MKEKLIPESIFNNLDKNKESLLYYFYNERKEIRDIYVIKILIIESENDSGNLEIMISTRLNRFFSKKYCNVFFIKKPEDWNKFLKKNIDTNGFIKK